jgi:hypothetical protein
MENDEAGVTNIHIHSYYNTAPEKQEQQAEGDCYQIGLYFYEEHSLRFGLTTWCR